jgi:hypothetical protein
MRITCTLLSDFLENIQAANVYQMIVYVDKTSGFLNDECTSVEVGIRASAVLQYDDGGQALLEVAETCGIDRHTADGGLDGTKMQTEMMNMLYQKCETLGLRVRPGTLDL